MFVPLPQNTLGPFLSPSSQWSVSATGLHILAPAALSKATPLNIYATSLAQFKPSIHLLQGNWPQESGSTGEIGALFTPPEAQALHGGVGCLLTVQGDFFP